MADRPAQFVSTEPSAAMTARPRHPRRSRPPCRATRRRYGASDGASSSRLYTETPPDSRSPGRASHWGHRGALGRPGRNSFGSQRDEDARSHRGVGGDPSAAPPCRRSRRRQRSFHDAFDQIHVPDEFRDPARPRLLIDFRRRRHLDNAAAIHRGRCVMASSWSWVTITKVNPSRPICQVHQFELGFPAQLSCQAPPKRSLRQ